MQTIYVVRRTEDDVVNGRPANHLGTPAKSKSDVGSGGNESAHKKMSVLASDRASATTSMNSDGTHVTRYPCLEFRSSVNAPIHVSQGGKSHVSMNPSLTSLDMSSNSDCAWSHISSLPPARSKSDNREFDECGRGSIASDRLVTRRTMVSLSMGPQKSFSAVNSVGRNSVVRRQVEGADGSTRGTHQLIVSFACRKKDCASFIASIAQRKVFTTSP